MRQERKIGPASPRAAPAPPRGAATVDGQRGHASGLALLGIVIVATSAALALLLPNLEVVGLWSKAELPVLARARGALGEPLDDLVTSPWLPDYLRSRSLEFIGGDLGIRLPHAVASALLVGLAAAIARQHGASWRRCGLTAAFALSFPLVLVGGSTIAGNAIGEVGAAVAVLAGTAAVDSERRLHWVARACLALVASASMAASVASAGIVFGLCLPLAAIASLGGGQSTDSANGKSRTIEWVSAGLWATTAAAAAGAVYLVLRQGEGFVPLLGAAKDLELMEFPQRRDATATLRECGYLIFPWGALAIVGLASPRTPRSAAAWLVLCVITTTLWSQVYGATPAPLTVPAAIVCAAATCDILDIDRAPLLRRLGLVVTLIGVGVAAKDATQTPSKITSPLHNLEGEQNYPDQQIGASKRLERLGTIVIGGWVFAFIISPPCRRRVRPVAVGPNSVDDDLLADHLAASPPWIERALERLRGATSSFPVVMRTTIAAGVAVATVSISCVSHDRLLLESGRQLSARAPLHRHAGRVAEGSAPTMLGVHRIRDEGVRYYGPPRSQVKFLSGRSDLATWLFPAMRPGESRETRVALIRRDDYPYVFSLARGQGQPLVTLDESHHDLTIVANQRIEGAEDSAPLAEIVLDRPLRLAHQTNVRFGDYIRLIGWEFEEPLRRGKTARLHMIFEVERPLPATAKLIARLQRGKLSRVNTKPHEFAEGLYPANYWRKGDYIHHCYEFEISRLETLPGEHDFIVAVKKTEKGQVAITDPPPEVKEGDFGVLVPGKEHEFATLGRVPIE